jgi:hypothetical protein
MVRNDRGWAGIEHSIDLMQKEVEKDRANSRRLREEGLDLVEKNAGNFLESMRGLARAHSRVHGQVTVDDLRKYAGEYSLHPHHKNAWGAILRRGKAGFAPIGYTQSIIPSNHARTIRVWHYIGGGHD